MGTSQFNLEGRVALVTGASSGLGEHFARTLAKAGAEVLLVARRLEVLQALVSEIENSGGRCSAVRLDVSSSAAIAELAHIFDPVDILVNNAGIVHEAAALDVEEAAWDDVMNINLKGMFLMAQTAGRAMRARAKGGTIINIASILGLRQAGGVLPYAVSKAGAIQLTKTMALELARFGIRVNAIAPGYVDTEMNADFWQTDAGKAMIRRIPQRCLARLEDLDGPLLLLASDASAYMTGSVLTVDGGHMLSTL